MTRYTAFKEDLETFIMFFTFPRNYAITQIHKPPYCKPPSVGQLAQLAFEYAGRVKELPTGKNKSDNGQMEVSRIYHKLTHQINCI